MRSPLVGADRDSPRASSQPTGDAHEHAHPGLLGEQRAQAVMAPSSP